ncbi:MAG TPA: DNA (cytosine-5-)-methyltransferase [Frankiaceae bacterium]|jgi:DNA (cytosine-5)-methyltransferase 1|nr:DNA (cytosine-5-)-methyltransferase [Frankiaceae bacterium]
MRFTFADLFAGIGGFHAALSALGGECRFVSELDGEAQAVYARNWGGDVPTPGDGRRGLDGDIVPLTESVMDVPKIDVLAAGFPCQPFSKSGFQRGINETRGTLFFNILRVLEERRPSVVILENVRNLAGPRHADTWQMIVRQLRQLGYKVSSAPTVFSPHLLPPDRGGTPQVRDRVFILGTYVGPRLAHELSDDQPVVPREPVSDIHGVPWDPARWEIETTVLPLAGVPLLEPEGPRTAGYALTVGETRWLDVWDDFVTTMRHHRGGRRLPGFPLWADVWLECRERGYASVPDDAPDWKIEFITKNRDFYCDNAAVVDAWIDRHESLRSLPASRRKLEWQAQDEARLWDCVIHFRPSGIRVKRATYVPALVAITQTSIIGPRRRRLTPREAARLQGLPDDFGFGEQSDAATYRQLGNGVHVGAAYYVLRRHVERDRALIPAYIADPILSAPPAPRIVVPGAGARANHSRTQSDKRIRDLVPA